MHPEKEDRLQKVLETERPESFDILQLVSGFIDQNIRFVKYTLYSVGVVGVCLILRSTRVFTKFTSPSKIPVEFFHKHICLHGEVKRCELVHRRFILHTEHTPIVSISKVGQGSTLPVYVSSVKCWTAEPVQMEERHKRNVNPLESLKGCVEGRRVWFQLLRMNSHSELECIVYFKPASYWRRSSNLGRVLVTGGVASVAPLSPSLELSPTYMRYYKQLLKDERKAERKRSGMWQMEAPSSLLTYYSRKLAETVKQWWKRKT